MGKAVSVEGGAGDWLERAVWAEIEGSLRQPEIVLEAAVDEIWILETIGYEQGGYIGFELYRDGKPVSGFDFQRELLTGRHENGMPLPR